MSNSNALSVIEDFRVTLTRMDDQIEAALPSHISLKKFKRVAMSALQSVDPREIVASDRRSVMGAIVRCAQDGLLLDGREAALVFYKGRCQYLPMVRGIMKLARNSGDVSKIVAQVVYENDEFDIQFVTDGPPITHRPHREDRGSAIGVYALAKLRDGEWTDPEWMTIKDVEKIRSRSYAKNSGPWVSDFNQMALKTVIKRAAKRWPTSTDLDELMRADDEEYTQATDNAEEVLSIPTKRASRTSEIVLGSVDGEAVTDDENVEGVGEEEVSE